MPPSVSWPASLHDEVLSKVLIVSFKSMRLHFLCVVCDRGATRDEHKDLVS